MTRGKSSQDISNTARKRALPEVDRFAAVWEQVAALAASSSIGRGSRSRTRARSAVRKPGWAGLGVWRPAGDSIPTMDSPKSIPGRVAWGSRA